MTQNDFIMIEPTEDGTFNVSCGEKWADKLGWDEMIGLVASITMPERRPCLHWLKTEAQHKVWEEILNGTK